MAPKFKDGDVVVSVSSCKFTCEPLLRCTVEWEMDFMGTHGRCLFSLRRRSACWMLASLSKNCTKWILWISRRMVSLRLSYNRWPIPRTIRLHGLYCNYFRSAIRTCCPLVLVDGTPKFKFAQDRCRNRHIQDTHLRRVDLRNINRWSQLAWYFHDLIPCRNTAVDARLSCTQPAKSESHQIPQAFRRLVLRHPNPPDLLFHSTQSP